MDAISTISNNPISVLIILLSALSLFSAFWWRAGSTHSLMERTWILIIGKSADNDDPLSEFNLSMRRREKFAFIYGLKFNTTEEIQKFLDWLKKNKITINEIQFIRRWFKPSENQYISQPPKNHNFWCFAEIGIYFLIIVLSGIVTVNYSALLQAKKSGVWFLSDGEVAHSPRNKWSFDLSLCKSQSQLLENYGFTPGEAKAICKDVSEEKLNEFINKAVKHQRAFASAVQIIFMLFTMFSIKRILSVNKTRELLIQLSKEESTHGSLDKIEVEQDLMQYAKNRF